MKTTLEKIANSDDTFRMGAEIGKTAGSNHPASPTGFMTTTPENNVSVIHPNGSPKLGGLNDSH